jgi:hypothetical protein
MTDLRQDDFKVEMVGEVTVPELNLILARIATAALNKKKITLTPGEARILTNHLEEN